MEPVPETLEAFEHLELAHAQDLRNQLRRKADKVREVVPDCVGISLCTIQHDVTFTLAATNEDIATLDAVQYLDDGPCLHAVAHDDIETFHNDDPLDENTWLLFAAAGASRGIRSTLTLPIRAHGTTPNTTSDTTLGSVNLYASTLTAFDGHHDELAAIFDAWAPGAVTNADLTFSTRQAAAETPGVLHGRRIVSRAVAVLARDRGVESAEAAALLTRSARRSGVSEVRFAEFLLELEGYDED